MDEVDEEYEHPILGTLSWDQGRWSTDTPLLLPAFAVSGWNDDYVGDHLSPAYDYGGNRLRPPRGQRFAPRMSPPKGTMRRHLAVEVCVADDFELLTSAQDQAIQFVMDHQETILNNILDAIPNDLRQRDIWEWMKEQLGGDFEKLTRLLEDRRGVLSLISFKSMCISEEPKKGAVQVGFHGNCAWDQEHAFGVATCAGTVIKLNGAEVGWNLYPG